MYRTKIQKTEDLEEDAAANCFSYKDDSYKDCTDSVVKKYYFQKIGCVPPWFTYDMDIVCNTTFDEDQWSDIPTMIYKNFDQTKFAECKPP